jgi:hypothetical protein
VAEEYARCVVQRPRRGFALFSPFYWNFEDKGLTLNFMQTVTIGPLRLTRDEIVAQLEQGARQRLHMSADEFVRAYCTGKLTDAGRVADLLMLAHLLDEHDPLFVAA